MKNAGLGFGIPYVHNGEQHEYIPDFIIRLDTEEERYLIIETKGHDDLKDIKKAAAERWCKAVNANGSYGQWTYRMAMSVEAVLMLLNAAVKDAV